MRVIVTGCRGLIGSEVAAHLEGAGHEVLGLDLALGHDLTDEDFVKPYFRDHPADALVNLFAINDHVAPDLPKPDLFNIPLESLADYMKINVITLFSVCREYARNNRVGSIVNFSSTYGLVSPRPHLYRGGQKHIGYSASKGAVIQLTRHLAAHLAPAFRVNCIAPGGVEVSQDQEFRDGYARQTPMGRMMRRHELNGLIDYLISEQSSYMTGAVISVDGGWTAW
jgi:NAD(P)-dependent dehydrogenase (short-subunit alcohol dehydrogenase family)